MMLFYVRHGDPIYDPDSLTPLGLKQADALSKRLGRYGIDKVFASSSNRAVLTATPTAELLRKEIVKMDWCHEGRAWEHYAFPNGTGGHCWPAARTDIKRLFTKPEVQALGEKWYEHPDIASQHDYKTHIETVNGQVDEWLASLGYEHDRVNKLYRAVAPTNERVALFAHYGFGMGFLSSLLDIPYPTICTRFNLSTSGMTVINFRDDNGIVIPEVLTWSNDSHIFAEGLPTRYNNEYCF